MTVSVVLSGCGEEKSASAGSSNSKYKEFITVDVFDALANYQGIQSGWFAKVVRDKFNMELNIIAPNVAGGGDTLFQTRSAAGNLGDLIIAGADNGRFSNMVKAGLLADMTELLEDKEIMKNYETAIKKAMRVPARRGFSAFPVRYPTSHRRYLQMGSSLWYPPM